MKIRELIKRLEGFDGEKTVFLHNGKKTVDCHSTMRVVGNEDPGSIILLTKEQVNSIPRRSCED